MKRSIAVASVIAIVIVAGAIVAFFYSGGTGSATTSSGSPTMASQNSGLGSFSVLLTDPPVGGTGTSRVYTNYDHVAAHNSHSDQSHGWIDLNVSGSIELTSIVNISKTIASANVKTGTYDMVRLNLTSATVTYQTRNQSAQVKPGSLTTRISGAANVNSSNRTAVIIDLFTYIFNTNDNSKPSFVITASARAWPVPPSQMAQVSTKVGAILDLATQAWWRTDISSGLARLRVTNATLKANSMSVAVLNTGNVTSDIKLVVVSPSNTSIGSPSEIPASFVSSAMFVVQSDGSLQTTNPLIQAPFPFFSSQGYNLTIGASVTMKYNSPVHVGYGLGDVALHGVIPGQSYLVTVLADNVVTSYRVVAS
jgi:hypothetical protein